MLRRKKKKLLTVLFSVFLKCFIIIKMLGVREENIWS